MATLGLRGHRRSGGFKPASAYLKAAAVIATVLVVPVAGSVAILSLKQVIPRHSYPFDNIKGSDGSDASDCSRFTRLAFKAGAPSPTFLQNGDRCEIADYTAFVQAAKTYNLRRSLLVGFFTVALTAALLRRILRPKP